MSAETAIDVKDIIPGKNYPSQVEIKEDGHVAKWLLQSYYVGMYCAFYFDGQLANQTGDHNNKSFVAKLKKDIIKAKERGATIEIGSLRECVLEIPK